MTEEKARRILVPFGDILLNGFVLPDGSYALSQSQVAEAIGKRDMSVYRFLVPHFSEQKQLKVLSSNDFRRPHF